MKGICRNQMTERHLSFVSPSIDLALLCNIQEIIVYLRIAAYIV